MRIEDRSRLDRLDRQRNIFYYVRIVILDRNEDPIQTIEGRTQTGSSVSINGSSSIRRTCNLTLVADETKNDLTDIDNLLSINKKIKIYTGIKQTIDWDKDIFYYDTEDPSQDPNVVSRPAKGENGKIYIDRRNRVEVREVTIGGKTKKILVKKGNDFPAYYWDEFANYYFKLNSLYDYENIIFWFPMGIYVITQPSISYGANGCTISLTCQDKMCLLNGTMGGNLPTSVVFDEYDQEIGHTYLLDGDDEFPPINDPNDYNVYHYNGKIFTYDYQYGWRIIENESDIPQVKHIRTPIFDIIQTAVVNYGEELINKVIINDVPLEIKQTVTYVGIEPLYYNIQTHIFTFDQNNVTEEYEQITPQGNENPKKERWYEYDSEHTVYILTNDITVIEGKNYYIRESDWRVFNYKDEIGYVWTDLTYPNSNKDGGPALISSIGDNVCTILDKIVQVFGNYEYFYDMDGNFVFQEIKNYLNNSYDPMKTNNGMKPYYIDSNKSISSYEIKNNNIKLIGTENYQADYFGDQKSTYTFSDNNDLVVAYTNNPNYTNLKNDYHIWGKNQDGNVLHYHIAIKEIPKKEFFDGVEQYPEYEVLFIRDSEKNYTGRIRMLQKEDFVGGYARITNNDLKCNDSEVTSVVNGTLYIRQNSKKIKQGIDVKQSQGLDIAKLSIQNDGTLKKIRAKDWRAQLYLQGLQKVHDGDRPDKYEQELLDFFDSIYEWGYYDDPDAFDKKDSDFNFEGRFKTDITSTPNELCYFLDFLEPVNGLYGMSVDDIGAKIHSYQKDNIIKLYNDEVPDLMLINVEWSDDYQDQIKRECNDSGQAFSNIEKILFDNLDINILGYTAQETARNFLYQYTNYNESITVQSIPVYYLDVNQRITVENQKTGINGDYITKQITLPLIPNGTMNITAVKAINRI